MLERIRLLNTWVDNLTMQETLQKVAEAVRDGRQIHHTAVNAGKIVALQRDEKLRESVNEADIINADGQAVIWAAHLLGKPLKERVTGIDLFTNLLAWAHHHHCPVYLLGARPDVLDTLVQRLSEKYAPELVAGYHHGYFKADEEKEIVDQIVESGAKLLFVAMSSPKKENFLYHYRQEFAKLNFIMGVGGSFDVLAGKTKRAPKWMRKAGLEWLHRFLQEPKRMWKRYLIGNTKFIFLVWKEKRKNKKYFTKNHKIKQSPSR